MQNGKIVEEGPFARLWDKYETTENGPQKAP